LLVARSVYGATCTVSSTNDSGADSLRGCLTSPTLADGDTIDATGISGTILLTSGPLEVNRNVTILGPGPANLAIDGNATYRVFEVHGSPSHNGDVVISGLTITNGVGNSNNFTDGAGGIYNDDMVGTVRIENCIVSNNAAGCCSGGGITNTEYLTISDSTVTGNSTPVYDGGGIKNTGSLSISNSTFSGNTTGRSGAGIYSTYYVTVDNSIISGNSAGGGGGGIHNEYESNGTVIVTNSTISGNSASYGGGINNSPGGMPGGNHLTVMNSTFSGNFFTAADQTGGGINNSSTATVIDSTISGNYGPANGGYGGGIGNYGGSLTVKNSTFSGNSSYSPGGGIGNNGGGSIQIGDTVLNAGASGGTIGNFSGTIASLGYNLASDSGGGFLTAAGDQTAIDPKLAPLQNNGGPTRTHALCTASGVPDASCTGASPAIDAGDPNFDPNAFNPPLLYDQRGSPYARVANNRIDIGAFEVQPAPMADLAITKSASPSPATVGSNITYTLTVTNNGPSTATGVTTTDTLPGSVTFVSSSSSQGTCSGTATVTCGLGSVVSGASATVTIVVTPNTATTLSNTASVSGNESDPTPNNNYSTALTTVNPPAPMITMFSPTSGPVGTSVTIAGINFTGASAVKFNGTSASFTVNSDTQIFTSVPSGATSGPISVTTSGGTATSSASFTVSTSPTPPSISSFSPTSGGAEAKVTIQGTNLVGATSVQFNGASASFQVKGSRIIAIVPQGATSGPISVTTPAGTAISANIFTVISPPLISGFAPATGPVGTSVTITGSNFTGMSAVMFNGTRAKQVTVVSATEVDATVPKGAKTGPISVTSSGGTGTSASNFTVTK
jgi:uncharacterized repeat protein (TIGR01451 family)